MNSLIYSVDGDLKKNLVNSFRKKVIHSFIHVFNIKFLNLFIHLVSDGN